MSFDGARREEWKSDETVSWGEITSNLSKTACRWAGVGIEREEDVFEGKEEGGR